MKIWDIERGRLDHDLEQRILGGISFAFSPVGRRAVSCTRDGILRCWNVGDWKISASLDCDSRFSSCAIGPGGSDIIVGGESGEVFFFRFEEPASSFVSIAGIPSPG